MTHVSPLTMGPFAYNSHVTKVTFKTLYFAVNTKVSVFLLNSFLCAINARGRIETGILICLSVNGL